MDVDNKSPGDNFLSSEFTQANTEQEYIVSSSDQTPAIGDLNQLGKGIANYGSGGADFYTAAGVDTITLTTISPFESPTKYFDGLTVRFRAVASNTGNTTCQPPGLIAQSVRNEDDTQIAPGAIEINKIITLVFNDASNHFLLHSEGLSTIPSMRNIYSYLGGTQDISDASITTPAFNAAFAVTEEGTVFFPAGTYVLNTTFLLASNVHVLGAGNDTIFQFEGAGQPYASPMLSFQPSTDNEQYSCVIENVAFDMNNTGTGIQTSDPSCVGFADGSIVTQVGEASFQLKNCRFFDASNQYVREDWNFRGVLSIENCSFSGGPDTTASINATYINCIGSVSLDVRHCLFQFRDDGSTILHGMSAIKAINTSGGTTAKEYNNVSDNTFNQIGVFNNSSASANDDTGIIHFGKDKSNITVRGNTFTDCTGNGGIKFQANVNNVSIDGNQFKDSFDTLNIDGQYSADGADGKEATFTSPSTIVLSSAPGFNNFVSGMIVQVENSSSNNGYYTVDTITTNIFTNDTMTVIQTSISNEGPVEVFFTVGKGIAIECIEKEGGSAIGPGKNHIISNNTMNNLYSGIRYDGENSGNKTDGVKIVNNQIQTTSVNAIDFTTGYQVSILGNTIQNTQHCGIESHDLGQGSIIANNNLYDVGWEGIATELNAATTAKVFVTGNIVHNYNSKGDKRQAYFFWGEADGAIFKDNTIWDSSNEYYNLAMNTNFFMHTTEYVEATGTTATIENIKPRFRFGTASGPQGVYPLGLTVTIRFMDAITPTIGILNTIYSDTNVDKIRLNSTVDYIPGPGAGINQITLIRVHDANVGGGIDVWYQADGTSIHVG